MDVVYTYYSIKIFHNFFEGPNPPTGNHMFCELQCQQSIILHISDTLPFLTGWHQDDKPQKKGEMLKDGRKMKRGGTGRWSLGERGQDDARMKTSIGQDGGQDYWSWQKNEGLNILEAYHLVTRMIAAKTKMNHPGLNLSSWLLQKPVYTYTERETERERERKRYPIQC